MTASLLTQLADALRSGAVKVVDLTQPLGPDTPVIDLPPIFAASPGFSSEEISHYDDKGPAWYWNTIRLGEHTGTHFDAPVHWITGAQLPDNTTDRIPARQTRRPRLRDRLQPGGRRQRRFPADERLRPGVGSSARPHSARLVAAHAHGLVQARRPRCLPEHARRRLAHAGLSAGMPALPGPRARGAGRRRRDVWARTPGRPAASTRPSRRTTSCRDRGVLAWPALPISTNCRRRAPS